ncbi:HsmA family protein [Coprobacter tertius]|uniref:HsmA family protein n=1 Tax=Coprobacter tertius TaxID=2944915 RepID=A0ABT1MHC3_9BACT|nr:HsmA family protein [Coprobacter tertius]MCP9610641.1 HsmA family protein [Coprobacter tertius]
MIFNQVDTHFLIAAIIVISSALVFYSIGVWSERIQKELKGWHVGFFLAGLCADTLGTGLMEHIAHLTHLHDRIHTITGIIAILLMFVHAIWALWTYYKGSLKAREHFNRFSIIVWCIWLIPYCIGIYLGMSLGK